MSRFTTRVELHEASEDDYEELHVAMENEGFRRTITGDEGEYHLVGDITEDQVLQRAKRAAATTGKSYSILVTEGSRKWWNLKKVEE
jgi:hypothetical protein